MHLRRTGSDGERLRRRDRDAQAERQAAGLPWDRDGDRPQRGPRRDRGRRADGRRRGDVRGDLEREHRVRRARGGRGLDARSRRPRRAVRRRRRCAPFLSRPRELRPRRGRRWTRPISPSRRPAAQAPARSPAPTSATSNRTARSTTPSSTTGSRRMPSPRAVAEFSELLGRPLPVLGLPGEIAAAAASVGLPFVHEAFLDRGYLPDGSLVPRGRRAHCSTTRSWSPRARCASRAKAWSRRSTGRSCRGRRVAVRARRLARRRGHGPRGARGARRRGRRGAGAVVSPRRAGAEPARAADGGAGVPPRGRGARRGASAARRLGRFLSGRGHRPRSGGANRAGAGRPAAAAPGRGPHVGARGGAGHRRPAPAPRARSSSSTSCTTGRISPRPPRCSAPGPTSWCDATPRRSGAWRSRASRRLRLSRRATTGPSTSLVSSAAHPRAGRRGGPCRRLLGRLPARHPGRLAADRHDIARAVRSGCRVPRSARTGNARPLPAVAAPTPRSVLAGAGDPVRDCLRGTPTRDVERRAVSRAPAAASGSSNRVCSRRCRISDARARHPSASPRREPSTVRRCAPRTACSATPRAQPPSRSRWAVCGPWPRPICGSP